MKCVGIQYLETIRKLKQDNVTLRRTIHVSFVPDEEIGGEKGMREFVKTDKFKNLNVGFALDEGLASPTNEFALFYGERCIWCKPTEVNPNIFVFSFFSVRYAHTLPRSAWPWFSFARKHRRRKSALPVGQIF